MSLENTCSRCGDVVMYCDCPYTDPSVVDDRDYTDNPTFEIYRGDETVEWERRGRSLGGSPRLLSDIMNHLSGDFEEILKPGFCLWMSHKDPYAVHFVAEHFVKGCSFSASAPDWSEWTKPGRIY